MVMIKTVKLIGEHLNTPGPLNFPRGPVWESTHQIQNWLQVVVAAVLFNTTRFIAISSLGPRLQKIPAYLKFLLFFQVIHLLAPTRALVVMRVYYIYIRAATFSDFH